MQWDNTVRVLSFAFAILATGNSINAAEVKVASAVVLRAALDDLAREFERTSSDKLTVSYDTAGAVRDRIQSGESADVLILPKPFIERLKAQGKIMPGSDVALARSTVAVAVRAGAPKPDIGSVESFKQAMLKARSIAYADPARGGASGTHFARVLERLGIAEQVNSKAKLIPGFGAVAAVARGEVEIAISQTMEILRDSGADLVGPLPAELQNTTDFVMVAAVPATAREPARAKAFMQFLLGEVARSVFKSKGMEPEGP